MRTIKTYTNGRFYDTLNKSYMSKDQLVALINKKEEIKIVMHKTSSDVTRTVMKRLAPLLTTKKETKLNIDNIKNWVSDQVDRRVEKAIALINLPSRDQISRLSADIEKLAKQVDALQLRMVKPKSPVKPTQKNTEKPAKQADGLQPPMDKTKPPVEPTQKNTEKPAKQADGLEPHMVKTKPPVEPAQKDLAETTHESA